MTEAAVAQQISLVLWAGFGIGLALAWVMSTTDFCTMGAVADIANFGDWTRMRMWVLAIAVAILGTQAMAAAGWIDLSRSHYLSDRWLLASNLTGGLMFGFGMVLASGCGSRTLLRAGAGNLKAWVVILVMGIAALMTLRGLFAVLRVQTLDRLTLKLPTTQDLPTLLAHAFEASVTPWRWGLGIAVAALLAIWALSDRRARAPRPLLGALAVGLLIAALWWVAGDLGYIAEDPRTLEPRFLGSAGNRLEALSFVAPIATSIELLAYWSDASRGLTLGISSVAGVLVGSGLHALAHRRFRWEGFAGVEDTANHLVGAVLMGVGGVLALGCTVGQGLSGVSTLAVGSFLSLISLIAGAVLALRYQAWRLGI